MGARWPGRGSLLLALRCGRAWSRMMHRLQSWPTTAVLCEQQASQSTTLDSPALADFRSLAIPISWD
jgi:hypothetical protein